MVRDPAAASSWPAACWTAHAAGSTRSAGSTGAGGSAGPAGSAWLAGSTGPGGRVRLYAACAGPVPSAGRAGCTRSTDNLGSEGRVGQPGAFIIGACDLWENPFSLSAPRALGSA